jgi:DNA repair protein RadC
VKTDKEVRERLIVSGAEKLSDAELLAVIIREGADSLSAVGLAEKILAEFPDGGLAELASAGVQRIRRAAGCGTVRAAAIAAAAEFGRRAGALSAATVNVIGSKDDVVRLFAPLADLPHEEFWALYLSSGGRVIDRVRLSQGGVSGTVVDHKLVVKRAVELLAASLILVHNHPSGVAQPSPDDRKVTETVTAAAGLFDITVVDHVIISRSGTYSVAEHNALPHK